MKFHWETIKQQKNQLSRNIFPGARQDTARQVNPGASQQHLSGRVTQDQKGGGGYPFQQKKTKIVVSSPNTPKVNGSEDWKMRICLQQNFFVWNICGCGK